MQVVAIAAVARGGVIGNHGDVPWHVPGDWRRFKQVTTGHVLVLGRTTYEGIGRPLPGRTTIVVTRNPAWRPAPFEGPETVHVAPDVRSAVALARELAPEKVCWIGGGGQVYRAALPLLTGLDITEIPLEPEGDTRFPDLDAARWRIVGSTPGEGFVARRYAPVVPVPGGLTLVPVSESDSDAWAPQAARTDLYAKPEPLAGEEAARWVSDGVASWFIETTGVQADPLGVVVVRRSLDWQVSIAADDCSHAEACVGPVTERLAMLDPGLPVRVHLAD